MPTTTEDRAHAPNRVPKASERAPGVDAKHPLWRRIALGVGYAASAFLLLTAAMPLLDVDWWWVRIGDYPRLQLLVAYVVAAICLLLLGWRRRWAVATACALAVASGWQLSWIFPYLPIAPEQTKAAAQSDRERTIRVMTVNVLMTNRRADELLAIIDESDPDILVITEPDRWWAEQLAVLEDEYPQTIEEPLENTYGMIVYSKLPLNDAKTEYLIESTTPSMRASGELPSGEKFSLYAVHPSPPRPGDDTDERDAELVIVGRRAKKSRLPTLVVGDLNDVGWSENTRLFQEVSGLLDPRRGRGMYSTFPAQWPMLRYPLDHLFHSDEFRLVRIEVLRDFGSDHLPVLFEMSYEPEGAHRQEAPQATPETHEEAQEQLENVDGE